jgi:triacylglycerol lipase
MSRDQAVVLVHGYLCLSPVLYWQGLRPLQREFLAAGHPVVRSRQPLAGPVASRARHLARFLDGLPYRRLILVGHSMGGLDARFVASRLDPRGRVRHVVTIGTPHRGTAVADLALRDTLWLTRLARFVDRGALRDLAAENAGRLDELMPDRPDVGYVALGGACPTPLLVGTLRRLGDRLAEEEGPNDGLVSLRSALRGEGAVSVDANHLELIGHRLPGGIAGCSPSRLARPRVALRDVLRRFLAAAGGAAAGAAGTG